MLRIHPLANRDKAYILGENSNDVGLLGLIVEENGV